MLNGKLIGKAKTFEEKKQTCFELLQRLCYKMVLLYNIHN